MGYEDVAKTAKTSPPNGYAANYPLAGTASVTFSSGDAYEVVSLPKFPVISAGDVAVNHNGVNLVFLDGRGSSGGVVRQINCGFRAFAQSNNVIHAGLNFWLGDLFFAGGSISKDDYVDAGMILGVLQGVEWEGDLNGATNVVAKGGSLQVSHSSSPRLGTLYVLDDTVSPAIQINNNSMASLDALHGSGNTGVLVDVRDSGCSINSRSSVVNFDATTSAAHPITIVGASKDYADLPFWSTNQNAGFVVN